MRSIELLLSFLIKISNEGPVLAKLMFYVSGGSMVKLWASDLYNLVLVVIRRKSLAVYLGFNVYADVLCLISQSGITGALTNKVIPRISFEF